MSHKLEVILLGTGGSIPAIGRNPSATIVQNEGKCYLVDCGEGTQYNLMKSTIKMNKLSHLKKNIMNLLWKGMKVENRI